MQIENPPFLVKEGGAHLAVTFYETPVRAVKKEDGKADTHVYYKGVMCRIEAPAMKNQVSEIMVELYDEKGVLLRKKIWEYHEGNPIYFVDRFKEQYKSWKERNGSTEIGTPLETWAKLDIALISHFKSEGIRSLEQLASVSDTNLHVLGINARAWRDGAIKHLEAIAQAAPFDEIKADNDRLREQLEAMQKQMADLMGGQSVQPKRRGRKPREQAQAA